jgi:hypothetical protein
MTILSGSINVAMADTWLPAGSQTNELTSDENLKVLVNAINGTSFEVGKRDSGGKYEIYKYEAFLSGVCSIRWRETHEAYNSRRRTLLEVQDLNVSIPAITVGSVDSNKIGNSGRLVSFQTQRLKPGITGSVHTTYEDGSENTSTVIQSGSGFYFSDNIVAQKVVKALTSAIRACSNAKGA